MHSLNGRFLEINLHLSCKHAAGTHRDGLRDGIYMVSFDAAITDK